MPAATLLGVHRPSDREAISLTVERIAKDYLEEIRQVQPSGPYRFIGYSFGGLIAYEMARLTVSQSERVALLALLDTPHPQFGSQLTSDEKRDVRRTYLADRKKKYLGHLKSGRLDRFVLDAFRLLRVRVQPLSWRIVKTYCKTFHRPLPPAYRNLGTSAMWHAYTPQEFSGRMVLLRAQGRDAEFGEDPSMGWRNIVRQGVEVHFGKGIHEVMMQPPNIDSFAELLHPYLSST